MRAVLAGLAGISPRSTTPNLVDLLSVLLLRCVTEAQGWLKNIMFDVRSYVCVSLREISDVVAIDRTPS